MKPIRIAYFTHDSVSEGVGASQVLGLCKQLTNLGHRVSLYSFEKFPPDPKTIKDVTEQNID